MTRSLACAFSLLLLALPTAWAAAKDLDGLDPATRKVFYNDQTAFVSRIELAGLSKERIDQALRGMFYPDRLAKAGGLLTQSSGSLDPLLADPRNMALLGFTHVTTVGIDGGTGVPVPYHLVAIGPKLQQDEAFTVWKFGLSGFSGMQIERLGGYAVFHPTGTKLPTAAYRAGVEEDVLLGLTQAPATATINWVMLPRKTTQELVKSLLGSDSNWAGLTNDVGGATYCGGYVTTGPQPEMSLYIRFGVEAKAAAMKQSFDAISQKEIAKAAAADQERQARLAKQRSQGIDTSAEEAELAKFPTSEQASRRLFGALPTQAFGRVFMLNLKQRDLQEITATIHDALEGRQ